MSEMSNIYLFCLPIQTISLLKNETFVLTQVKQSDCLYMEKMR